MDLPLILQGMIIGFSMAAPIGPVGILCIRRSLKRGRLSGFVTGMGTATMDGIYAGISIFGIALIGDFLVSHKTLLELFAVIFLLFLGYKIFNDKTNTNEKTKLGKKGLISDFLSTFVITMSNPMTIFGLTAIFASIHITKHIHGSLSAFMIVLGVFLGSSLWWFILSGIVCFIGKKTDRNILSVINRTAGIGLIGFGLFLLIKVLVG